MKSARLALILFCAPVACDSAAPEASEPAAAKADAKPGASANTEGSGAGKAAQALPIELPADAEAAGKALEGRHSSDDGFSGDLSEKDLPGLLWLAAHGEKPLAVADALYEASGFIGLDEAPVKALLEPASRIALSRLDDASFDVAKGAFDLLHPALSADSVDPLVASAVDRVLVSGSSTDRKVLAASQIHLINFDAKSSIALTKVALSSDEPAVVLTTLSWMSRFQGDRGPLLKLIEPFLAHKDPAHVGAALQAYSRNADKSDATQAAVKPFLQSKDGYVRAHALFAYAKLAGKTSASAIAADLDNADPVTDPRITYAREDGRTAKAGPYLPAKEIRQAAVQAIRHADPTSSISVDWNKPASVKAAYASAKAWAKKQG